VNQKKRKIIDDLLLKNPMGPKKTDASFEVTPITEHFGYSKEALFDVGLHTQAYVESYIRDRFFEGKDKKDLGRKNATVTRRTKRLWARLEPSVRKVKKEGGLGIYKILESKWSYGTPLGYLHAVDIEEAQKLANMFFGYLITRTYSPVPYVEIISHEKMSELSKYNEEVIKSLQETIKYTEDSIQEKTKFLKRLANRMKAVIALQIGQASFDLGEEISHDNEN
jgi:hypothetical protein